MTIRIEREAFVQVIDGNAIPTSSCEQTSFNSLKDAGKSELIDIRSHYCHRDYSNSPLSRVDVSSKILPVPLIDSSLIQPDLVETDDDYTVGSTCSSETTISIDHGRRVTFASPLITEVRTRPRTLPEEVHNLFYSYEETQRFRQQYRDERRIQDEQCLQCNDCTKSFCISKEGSNIINSDDDRSFDSPFRISRVVVMHKDSLEAFVDNEIGHDYNVDVDLSIDLKAANKDFFDNDSFW
eukprot:CAMPEP_0184871482 /NCGR_PEP_ID=MMETSP0580-20130426/40745_1 /TAXON_ID=1118495 /ORGANISM="Dactyliosolen fragilissimus" /LENGTH=238 /DNA_ID=CAMNT_0027374147 /DNA_START=408 /DNA_END=1121 /DNA_ORIENTATION=-